MDRQWDMDTCTKDTKSYAGKTGKEEMLSAWSRLLSTLYGLILISFGLIFPITEALRHQWLTTYTSACFNIYCDGVASVFLVYLIIVMFSSKRDQVCACGFENQAQKTPIATETTLQNNNTYQNSCFDGDLTTAQDDNDNSLQKYNTFKHSNSVSSMSSRSYVLKRSLSAEDGISIYSDNYRFLKEMLFWKGSQKTPSVGIERSTKPSEEVQSRKELEGSSFYLRLGALVFGIGNFVYICLQLEFYVLEPQGHCPGHPLVYPMFTHLCFLTIQTFFIFKTIKVDVCSPVVVATCRFGFAHLLASNMCIWLRILLAEVMEGVRDGMNEEYIPMNLPHSNNSTAVHATLELHTKEDNETTCNHREGIYDQSAPYLFPFILEYSLTAVAIIANLYRSLNTEPKQAITDIDEEMAKVKVAKAEDVNFFAKAHRGLFIGSILVAVTILSVILFFNYEKKEQHNIAMLIYHISDILLHLILLPPVIHGLVIFKKFKLSLQKDNAIDNVLLLLSICGIVIYYVFALISITASLSITEKMDDIVVMGLSITAAMMNIVQCLLQGVYIIAGLQTCALTPEQERLKPGRGNITFLIVGNVALWIFKTLQVKEAGLHRFSNYYGVLAWPIIMNINLPLALFYRFHSSVCLADMWSSAYKLDNLD